jgi:hypothetical protein
MMPFGSAPNAKKHNEELHNLYYPPIIKSVIKSGGMRWMECQEIHIEFESENLKGRDRLRD